MDNVLVEMMAVGDVVNLQKPVKGDLIDGKKDSGREEICMGNMY